MSEDQKKQLETQLRNIANELRGKMNADEFRDYILWFIFYKYLSEKIDIFANKILKNDNMVYQDLDETTAEWKELIEAVKQEALDNLWYFLKPSDLFHQLAIKGNEDKNTFILWDLWRILNSIEQSTMWTDSEEDFDSLFSDLDLDSSKLGKTPKEKNKLICKVLTHLDKIDFELWNSEIDVLGDAYEYLIQQFASGAGKKAGEFYTPQEISTVLAKIVTAGKTQLKSVYDPTCGSWSLLLRVAKEVEKVGEFVGQEMNNTTYNLCRMNMILHDVHYREFDIQQEDTLEHPKHLDKRFEAVVANPPFSAKRSASELFNNDDRFSQYGRIAPGSKADYAFITHMIYQLAENGTMAVVMPHGALFRWWAEWHIRKFLIKEKNYLDAVIWLPANLFYGTSIPASILVFKKCRANEWVLFIDASKAFEKNKNQNKLTPEHIEKIVQTYTDRVALDKYSYVATTEDLEENEYNLNIPRYVDTFEEEEPVDLDKVASDIQTITKDMKATDSEIAKFCDELRIASPFIS